MIDILLILGGVLLGGLGIYLLLQLLLRGSIEEAVERTISDATGVVAGIITAGFIVAVELAALLGTMGDLVGMAAGTISAGIITLLGVASLSDVIDIAPELFGLIGVIIIIVAHMMGGGR